MERVIEETLQKNRKVPRCCSSADRERALQDGIAARLGISMRLGTCANLTSAKGPHVSMPPLLIARAPTARLLDVVSLPP